jgi:hypothetical protein
MTSIKKLREFQIGDKVIIAQSDNNVMVGDYGYIIGVVQELDSEDDELNIAFKRYCNDDQEKNCIVESWANIKQVIKYPYNMSWEKVKAVADTMRSV